MGRPYPQQSLVPRVCIYLLRERGHIASGVGGWQKSKVAMKLPQEAASNAVPVTSLYVFPLIEIVLKRFIWHNKCFFVGNREENHVPNLSENRLRFKGYGTSLTCWRLLVLYS